MMKRFLGFILFSMTLGLVWAQDMPPLPPLPDQSQAANSNSTSSIPASAPTPAANSASPALPPLPGDQASQTAPALSAPAPPAGSDQSQAPATQAASPEPAATPAAEETASTGKPLKRHRHPLKPWQVSKYRPNVIFGGWVKAKGGNESSRMAWTSQEVLNALLFKKYTLISPLDGKAEDGNYDGEPGSQWRLFTFNAPKSKVVVQVYIRQSGQKVWMRVGPGEGVFPEATSLKQATQIRAADLTALHLLKKKFGRRLSPNRVVASWESPYRYSQETADE
ncbi:MAG TPA: hypothetical protein VK859_04070 [bacterium]|jgi:hypothetical protein|nr:hypothetical protein [bacterium]